MPGSDPVCSSLALVVPLEVSAPPLPVTCAQQGPAKVPTRAQVSTKVKQVPFGAGSASSTECSAVTHTHLKRINLGPEPNRKRRRPTFQDRRSKGIFCTSRDISDDETLVRGSKKFPDPPRWFGTREFSGLTREITPDALMALAIAGCSYYRDAHVVTSSMILDCSITGKRKRWPHQNRVK